MDFICLQETRVSTCFECDSWFSSYGFLTVTSLGSTHSCGSVILYRPLSLYPKLLLTVEVALSSRTSSGMILLLVWPVSMLQTGIQKGMTSLPSVLTKLIRLYLQLFVGFLTRSLTDPLTVVVSMCLTRLVRVPSLLGISFVIAALSTFGGLYILPPLPLPGLGQMGPFLPELT